MTGAELDALARQRAQEEFTRPVVLEAGAGTGKTAALTARVLAWSLGPGWALAAARVADDPEAVAAATLEGVLAITFTEAASAEMAERVAEALAAMAADSPPPWVAPPAALAPAEVRERARHLLAALDHLTVSTIHSYCLALLADNPFAAGLHPGFAVDADGAAVREAVRAEIEAWLAEAAVSEDVQRLAAAGQGPQALAAALATLVAAGVEPHQLDATQALPLWRQQLRRLRGALAELHEAGMDALSGAARNNSTTLATAAALAASREFLATAGDGEMDETLAGLRRLWPEVSRERLHRWGRGEWSATAARILGERAEAVAAAAAPASVALEALLAARPAELAAASRVLAPLLHRAGERLRRQGVMTFHGLLREAQRLLSKHPAVAERERGRWRQVLVDEFQDTDELQCGLVAQLCLAGPEEERPGLFVVGDPKQSIYAWRSADLAAYEGFLERVREAGGEVHQLCVNFRSAPPILAEVEVALAPVMVYERDVQPPFQCLLASEARRHAEGFCRGRWAPVEYWETPASESSEERAALAARAVAEDIRELNRQKVALESVGVLLRTTTELEKYLDALRWAGVPYAVARDRSYYRRREVIEAAALIRTVVDSTDHLALLTWLRSPLVGVPDAALLPIWRAGLPGLMTDLQGPEDSGLSRLEEIARTAAAAVPPGVPGIDRVREWERLLPAAVRQVAELRRRLRQEPFSQWLERLRQATWLEAGEAARHLGRFRLANLQQLFERLERGIEEAGGDQRAVLVALRRAMAEGVEVEGGRPRDAAAGGVQVMTVHGAKGLDFDHVYLVQAHQCSRRDGRESTAVVRVGSRLFLRALGLPWPQWQDGVRYRDAVRRAELVRTLYVAMTRARERLVIVGDWDTRGGRGDDSHLALLRHRRPDPAPAPAHQEGAWRWVDAGGVRWVTLPRVEAAERVPVLPSDRPVKEVQRAIAEAKMLRELDEQATNRAARPRAGTVTGEVRAGEERDGVGEEPRRQARAAVAAAAGTAVHAVLERLDFAAPLEPQVSAWTARLPEVLQARLGVGDHAGAVARAGELLAGLQRPELAQRLAAAAAGTVAREIPVLLPGGEVGSGPLGYLVGAVDLLYREAGTGELVVVDFKTDALARDDEMERAAASYRRQGELYCRALQQALELATRPHFELWFLHPGRVVRLW